VALDADVSRGIVAFTGPACVPGYHAFMLPGSAGMTLAWLSFVLTELTHDRLRGLTTIMAGAGVLLLFFGFWMWAFMLPRRLAPTRWRDQRGWIPTMWRQFRGKPTYDQSTQRGRHEK
jgi:hypothetical protein